MNLYVSVDGDDAGRLVGRAVLADDVEGLVEASRRIEAGEKVIRDWAASVAGRVIEAGGDESTLEISADMVGKVDGLREKYRDASGLTLSAGVGRTLSEAAKALLAAKVRGKSRTVVYDEVVGKEAEEAERELAGRTESDKLADEYLQRTEDLDKVVLDPSSGYRIEHTWHDQVNPQKTRLEHRYYKTLQISAYAPDGTEVGRTIMEREDTPEPRPFHTFVKPEHRRKGLASAMYSHAEKVLGKKLVPGHAQSEDALALWHNKGSQFGKSEYLQRAEPQGSAAGAPSDAGSAGHSAAPEHSQGEVAQAQVSAGLAGAAPPDPNQEAEAAFRQAAEQGEQEDQQRSEQQQGSLDGAKKALTDALALVQQQLPSFQELQQARPKAFQALLKLMQSTVGLAREVKSRETQMQKSEEDLQKRSKNVRRQQEMMTPRQAEAARVKYAQSIGLRPHREVPKGAFPSARRNVLPYSSSFGIEHETAHAMMTPPHVTLNQYQKWLTQHAKAPVDSSGGIDWEGDVDAHEEAVGQENIANQLENLIDRRAGVPQKFRSEFRTVVRPETMSEDAENPSVDYNATERRQQQRHSIRSSDASVPSEDIREDAARHVKQFDMGAKFTPQGRIKQPTGIDSKINQGGGLAALRQRAAARGTQKAEDDLEKRSKNVREQTRNITHKQAFQRRIAYTQRLGLEPRLNEDRMGFPQPHGNVLEHGRVFPVEHELGHAMMTPEGRTVEDHQGDLDARHGTDAGAHDENVATQMEFGIDRRAGVGGKGGSLRDYKTKNGREHHGEFKPPPAGGDYVANLHSKVGNSKLSASPALQAEARAHLGRFDNGTRFDGSGTVDTPGESMMHSRINTGTAGVAGLRQRAAARGKVQKAADSAVAVAHRKENLPVGTVHHQEMKVNHGDGKSSWVSMKAGQVQGDDVDVPLMGQNSHPVSSRDPTAR